MAASESYRRAALSENGRKIRSETITHLNLHNLDFQEKRKKSCKNFLNSDQSLEYRKLSSERAKNQHKNGQADYVRLYFAERYQGSNVQKEKSIRAKMNNPGNAPGAREKMRDTYIRNSELGLHNKETKFKKKKYKDTDLIYQSSYELDFLDFCEKSNLLGRIKNSPCFTSEDYPYNFYAPDFILDNMIVIEIKSWYVENLQEKRYPGILDIKRQLVESKGYNFLYIRDKDYTILRDLFGG
jgi:hypothetical protein